jgi:hypothetical protein
LRTGVTGVEKNDEVVVAGGSGSADHTRPAPSVSPSPSSSSSCARAALSVLLSVGEKSFLAEK